MPSKFYPKALLALALPLISAAATVVVDPAGTYTITFDAPAHTFTGNAGAAIKTPQPCALPALGPPGFPA